MNDWFAGYGTALLDGARVTLSLALWSWALACGLGLLSAVSRLSDRSFISGLARAYTTLVRSVPDMVLLLLIFFGGQMALNAAWSALADGKAVEVDAFTAGATTLGVIYGAYLGETFRGAFMAIPAGQREAALAAGMGPWLTLRRILLPQMLRHALAGLENNWLVLLKSTAIVSVIGLNDLMQQAGLAAGATHEPFRFYLAAAGLYLALTALSETLFGWLRRTLAQGMPTGTAGGRL